MQKILIGKQEAAVRQTMTALELYFQEKDEVSTHTLAAAAYNIFRDLAANGIGKTVLMKQASLDHIDKKNHRGWLDQINRFENFFKHADRDHDKELEFYPGSTEFMLWENCSKVLECEKDTSPLVMAFITWFMARHSEALLSEENRRSMTPEFRASCDEYKKIGRKQFYDRKYPDFNRAIKFMQENPK